MRGSRRQFAGEPSALTTWRQVWPATQRAAGLDERQRLAGGHRLQGRRADEPALFQNLRVNSEATVEVARSVFPPGPPSPRVRSGSASSTRWRRRCRASPRTQRNTTRQLPVIAPQRPG